ncbi:competence protein ComK [Sporosarcina sp. FA9]|uniref:competence protein ComK n=1 Tax=Sporosarcina sp. FA9 TaxID=3413030 RepID=UPI003F65E654
MDKLAYSDSFLLDYGAKVLLPVHDETGTLFTTIRTGNREVRVKLGPTKLIDFNLGYFGSSLRGASDGARMILGKSNMNPVIFNERLAHCWFPSKSPYKEDCIWFALHQIKDYVEKCKHMTQVIFHDGSTFVVGVSRASFDAKVSKAYKLMGKREIRKNVSHHQQQVAETKELYRIRKHGENSNVHILDSHILIEQP